MAVCKDQWNEVQNWGWTVSSSAPCTALMHNQGAGLAGCLPLSLASPQRRRGRRGKTWQKSPTFSGCCWRSASLSLAALGVAVKTGFRLVKSSVRSCVRERGAAACWELACATAPELAYLAACNPEVSKKGRDLHTFPAADKSRVVCSPVNLGLCIKLGFVEVSRPTEVRPLFSTEVILISASAGACCFATVEKLLVPVTQPGEQYRGSWKGCGVQWPSRGFSQFL